jgi:hypothetical protein
MLLSFSSAGTPPPCRESAKEALRQHAQMALCAPLIETAGQNLQYG